MNLLLFSDLHADVRAAAQLVKMSDQADVVIGAGDFGNARRQLSVCINILRSITRPTVLVPGNNESFEELLAACSGWRSVTVLHGNETEILGTKFFGIGGGIPTTPFGSWSFDLSEAEAEGMLQACPNQAVLVSHSPPKGCVDISSSGKSLGSVAVRDAVIRTNPRLVVCGHIHNCGGQTTSANGTPVVNAGPSGMLWHLDA